MSDTLLNFYNRFMAFCPKPGTTTFEIGEIPDIKSMMIRWMQSINDSTCTGALATLSYEGGNFAQAITAHNCQEGEEHVMDENDITSIRNALVLNGNIKPQDCFSITFSFSGKQYSTNALTINNCIPIELFIPNPHQEPRQKAVPVPKFDL